MSLFWLCSASKTLGDGLVDKLVEAKSFSANTLILSCGQIQGKGIEFN